MFCIDTRTDAERECAQRIEAEAVVTIGCSQWAYRCDEPGVYWVANDGAILRDGRFVMVPR